MFLACCFCCMVAINTCTKWLKRTSCSEALPSTISNGYKLSAPSPYSLCPLMQMPYIILFSPYCQLTNTVSLSTLLFVPNRIFDWFNASLIKPTSCMPNLCLINVDSNICNTFSVVNTSSSIASNSFNALLILLLSI